VTVDSSHSPAYAVGYLFKQVQPRIAMVTHTAYDENIIPEMVADIRTHYKGLFQFAAILKVSICIN